jgi:hypothetical protein
MRRIAVVLFLFSGLFLAAQQTKMSYRIHLRVQYMDTNQYCGCPQDDNTQDYGAQADCNSMGNVMINLYNDSLLLRTYYTDQTGYCERFNLPDGKYRLVFRAPKYDTAEVKLDFTASDMRNSIISPTGNQMHFKTEDGVYFICLVMEGKRKKGVKLVPKN